MSDHTASRRRFMLTSVAAACGLPAGRVLAGEEPAAPITGDMLAAAEKLAAIELTDAERAQALEGLDEQIERYRARRAVELPNELSPATVFDPRPTGWTAPPQPGFTPSSADPGPVPDDDRAIAYAPLTALSHWIRTRRLTSRRLTEIYLERLGRVGPSLECTVTLTADRGLARADAADREITAGRWRGPLHGIPWGAKDLLDTAGIATTWGAEPYRHRVPQRDAEVVRRLDAAGAVLVAKLSLGALAYGDRWFGGRTRNPWNLEQGSSGSSAGSAAATAAGLVGFSLGTETYGSIVSPCMRCGATGLRPTFGRVPRTGAMALCWSLDKIGPIARTVEDCMLVLAAINGADPGDPASRDMPLGFEASRPARGLRVGYAPAWFEGDGVPDADRAALAALGSIGVELVEVQLPDWPYASLFTVLLVEAAACFDELTRSGLDDQLSWQEPQAWPNTFRQTRFAPAVEYLQAQRFRRMVMEMMARTFEGVDALISPSYAGDLLLVTNNTGHPSLTLRCGFGDDGTPRSITLWGRLFDEATLARLGMGLERAVGAWHRTPPL